MGALGAEKGLLIRREGATCRPRSIPRSEIWGLPGCQAVFPSPFNQFNSTQWTKVPYKLAFVKPL